MAKKHIGQECMACRQKLHEDDDIVVCPECGTPYHRRCWEKEGRCINDALHVSGESWIPNQELQQEQEVPPLKYICPNCGAENAQTAEHCENCGVPLGLMPRNPVTSENGDVPPQRETFRERCARMTEEMEQMDPYCGMDPDAELGSESLRDVADFVGSNKLYYLPKFRRFHETGGRFSLNFPCMFFPQLYFAHRKMWKSALLFTVLFLLIQIPYVIISLETLLPAMTENIGMFGFPMQEEMYTKITQNVQTVVENIKAHENFLYKAVSVCNYLELCMKIVLGLLGNWMYYRFALRKVRQIREKNLSESIRHIYLRKEGGVSFGMLIGVFLAEYVLTLLLFMLIFLLF